MAYGVTAQGFVMKRMDEILNEMQTEISEELGFDISTNPQSALNAAIVVPIAARIATLWEVAQDSYYAKYPATASGINLDNACQYGSVRREPNRRTRYLIHVTGTEGSIITANSYISSNTNPVVLLYCAAGQTLTRAACNKLVIKTSTTAAGTYTISLNGTNFSYTASSGATSLQILQGLQTAFQLSEYTTTLDSEELTLTIEDENLTRTNNFGLTTNLTTATVTALVYYYTEEYGDINMPFGTINTIVTNISGLQSVTNLLEPVAGRLQQTDDELRKSYAEKSYLTSESTSEGIRSYILDKVSGIESCQVYTNDNNIVDSEGRPPHSIEAVVNGGSDTDVAEAIYNKKPGGIATYGTTSATILSEYGESITVYFSRPDKKYIWLQVTITADGNMPENYQDLVKSAILTVGDAYDTGQDVLFQTFIQSVYQTIDNTILCQVKVGVSNSEYTEPSTYAEQNVTIGVRELAVFGYDRIEVTST